jgi:hypothetical protein
MTNESRIPNVEGAFNRAVVPVCHSDFGIASDFVIRHSDLRSAARFKIGRRHVSSYGFAAMAELLLKLPRSTRQMVREHINWTLLLSGLLFATQFGRNPAESGPFNRDSLCAWAAVCAVLLISLPLNRLVSEARCSCAARV